MNNVYGWFPSRKVVVNFENLPPRNDLRNHSPDGFGCGYGGSGAAQLALAILAYEYGDEDALRYYQQFKWKVIAKKPQNERWILTSEQIRVAMEEIRSEG